MTTGQLRFGGAALFYLIVLLSGFWLSRSGKPFGGVIFNIHKLVSLAGVALFVFTMYRTDGVAELSAVGLVAGLVTSVSLLALIATGGLLSTGKRMPALIQKLHHTIPYLALVSTAVTLYLLPYPAP